MNARAIKSLCGHRLVWAMAMLVALAERQNLVAGLRPGGTDVEFDKGRVPSMFAISQRASVRNMPTFSGRTRSRAIRTRSFPRTTSIWPLSLEQVKKTPSRASQ